MKTILMDPFPAVRVNSKGGRFTPRAQQYHDKMNTLRNLIGNYKDELIKHLLNGECKVYFYMGMPKKWSEKKRKEMNFKPHDTTPDLDNCFKAVTDTLFYKTEYNDKCISKIDCEKVWYDGEGKIEFIYPLL